MAKDATPTQIKAILKEERARVAKRNREGGGGGNIGGQLAKTVRGVGEVAQIAGDVYGATNPPITIGTGRNLLHFSGDLHDTPRSNGKTLILVNPFAGTKGEVDSIMLDAWGTLTGERANFGGAPDTFAGRARGAIQLVGYNARSSITPGGGIATTWGPLILGPIFGRGVRGVLNGAANVAGQLQRLTPKMLRR